MLPPHGLGVSDPKGGGPNKGPPKAKKKKKKKKTKAVTESRQGNPTRKRPDLLEPEAKKGSILLSSPIRHHATKSSPTRAVPLLAAATMPEDVQMNDSEPQPAAPVPVAAAAAAAAPALSTLHRKLPHSFVPLPPKP
jgi:hypothetical protein